MAHAGAAIACAMVTILRKGTSEGGRTLEERIYIYNYILTLHIIAAEAQQDRPGARQFSPPQNPWNESVQQWTRPRRRTPN
jgi:hypothetical protein